MTLVVKDGSDPVDIEVEDVGGGTYEVYAPGGYNKGCSYELNLKEGWTFLPSGSEAVQNDSIRTAAFSIYMKEVENLKMNENIGYVPYSGVSGFQVGGMALGALTSDADLTGGGSFSYSGANGLTNGQVLCIYAGTDPRSENHKATDAMIYVKVSGVSGNTVNFKPLEAEDQADLYEIPDNFPIQVDVLPTGENGTVNISNLDTGLYAQMAGENGTLDNAKAALNAGDFVTLYVNSETATENTVYFGKVTGVNEATGDITFKKSNAAEIRESGDLYKKVELDGNDLITEEKKQEIERTVRAQVENSGFGEEAAYMLLDMVSQTDGFQNTAGLREVIVRDAEGNVLSPDSIQKYANAGIHLYAGDDDDDDDDDKVKVTVSLVTGGDQLHYKNKGVQLLIGVEAEFETEPEEGEGKVEIKLSAAFTQEVAFDPAVKGNLVYKEVLGFIPVPTGVQVTANIDVKSFTAMSLKAEIFTSESEDEGSWKKFKKFLEDPSALGDIPGVPDWVKDGVKDAGDALKKIKELKKEIKEGLEGVTGTVEEYEGYISAIWDVLEVATAGESNIARAEWDGLIDQFDWTDVTDELMNMLELGEDEDGDDDGEDGGPSIEYIESLEALMDRYSEMLEKETNWTQLVSQEMFDTHTPAEYGVMIGIEGNFVVRADLNLAIGSNLQYEVGKRYSFWFRVGLFTPTSGSSSMDLIDESFAFQFYVMGKIGVKAGVRLKLYAAIGSKDAISVGVTTELGPYLKLYGFFIYDYSRMRGANTLTWTSKEQMAGALFLEFGLYLMVGMEGKALWLEFDKDFLDKEYPLLTAGGKHYYYDFDYEPLDEADEIVVYNDGTAPRQPGCAVSMVLPEYTRALKYLDLPTGAQSTEALDPKNYSFTVSNPNFRADVVEINGKQELVVSVISIPSNVRLMQCDLTITYKHGKLAFSSTDITTTVHLAWTNMTAAEYQQVFNASVVVPSRTGGGTEAVWTQRVRKGQPFNLPTEDEIKALLSWNSAKYIDKGGYGSQQTEGLTLIRDSEYRYDVDYRTYSLTVTNVGDVEGASRTFTTGYGEPFDFSALPELGQNGPDKFTRFTGLTLSNGENLDLSRPVSGNFAEALLRGATATARYEDETVTATFVFSGQFDGNKPGNIEMKLRRGDEPNDSRVRAAVPDGLTISRIYPNVGPIEGDTVYEVVCEVPRGEMFTITFNSNGGGEVPAISRAEGTVLGTLPTPERAGYGFDGWYTDNETFQNKVEASTAVTGNMTLYAKWTEGGVTVSFNVNGGMNLAENTKTVAYGQPYGGLPVPVRSGYHFLGWFTEPEGGTEVKADTIVSTEEAHTLYAHWRELKEIPRTVFDFGERESFTYEKGQVRQAQWTFTPVSGETYTEGSFTVEYIRQSDPYIAENTSAGLTPTNAGKYNVHIHRDADEFYDVFDEIYGEVNVGVLVIEQATRDMGRVTADDIEIVETGFASVKATLNPRNIDDLTVTEQLRVKFRANGNEYVSQNNIVGEENIYTSLLYDLYPNLTYIITQVGIDGDMNYKEAWSGILSKINTLKSKPTSNWSDAGNYDISWYNDSESTFTITTAEQLAGLAWLVHDGKTFAGKTIKLGADIDLSAHQWTPIGVNTTSLQTKPFCGVFDGNSKTISGVYVPVGNINSEQKHRKSGDDGKRPKP